MTTLLFVSLSIAEADLATDSPPHKSESTPVPVPNDSVLHLIPEKTLGLIYCPNLLELDSRINTLVAELSPQTEAPDVVAKTLSNTFKTLFESSVDFEEVGLDLSQDFAIFLTSVNPLQLSVLAHLTDPEAMKQMLERVTQVDERAQYKEVTYWNDSGDDEYIAILGDMLVFSDQREVCENVIDIYKGTMKTVTKNPDYISFFADISEDDDQLAVYFDVESAIATLNRSLEEELEVVIDNLEDADEDDDIAPFLKGISEGGITFIRQVRYASVRLQMEGTDVQIKPFLKFKSGSEFLEVFEEVSDELGFLGELPDRTIINGAFQGSPKFLTEISTSWFSFFPKGNPEVQAQRKELLEQVKHFYESLADRWSFSLSFGDTLLPQYLFIYELKDEESAKTYLDETILKKLNYTEAYQSNTKLT